MELTSHVLDPYGSTTFMLPCIFFPDRSSYTSYLKTGSSTLPCQFPGFTGSALGLVGPMSAYCDWVKCKIFFSSNVYLFGAARTLVWTDPPLRYTSNKDEQIRPWDTRATSLNRSTPEIHEQQGWTDPPLRYTSNKDEQIRPWDTRATRMNRSAPEIHELVAGT